MAVLQWDPLDRSIQTGVERGVLYPKNAPGESWSGLINVFEEPTSNSEALYFEGRKYFDNNTDDCPTFAVDAFTYPDALFQYPIFDFSYRTQYHDGYQIHLIYNVQVPSGDENYQAIGDSVNPTNFSWTFTTSAVDIPNAKPSSHLIVDSNQVASNLLTLLEEQLYGTANFNPYMPTADEVVGIFQSTGFVIVDHGNGSWTAIGPDSAIVMLDATSFQITWPSATFIDAESYSISST
jgi:hypothetical protein